MVRTSFRCSECGWATAKWVGRCGECSAWGTVAEQAGGVRDRERPGAVTAAARPMSEIAIPSSGAVTTGVGELDRVLGGGLVPGSVVLLAGEPGVGKSTLLLEVAAARARTGQRVLYVSGEESAGQVRLRAERTGAVHPSLYLAAETDLGAVLTHLQTVSPSLLVLDSVQTVATADADGVPGGVTQVRAVAAALVSLAKRTGMAVMLIGHVTKDGAVAGPRALEHVVDIVLHFEGERTSPLRLVRASKNRHGPVDEIGCFELGERGIVEVADPTGLFVSRHDEPIAGTCVTVAMEGRRPLLAEVQSLVAPSALPAPRRATTGVDPARTAMVLAVLQRRAGMRLATADVYVATVGGARVREPAADLATAIATASASTDTVVPTDLVALGELGLAGEIRRVSGLPQRLREAARLGFRSALVPSDLGGLPPDSVRVEPLQVVAVPDLRSALRVLRLSEGQSSQRIAPNAGRPRPLLRAVPPS